MEKSSASFKIVVLGEGKSLFPYLLGTNRLSILLISDLYLL